MYLTIQVSPGPAKLTHGVDTMYLINCLDQLADIHVRPQAEGTQTTVEAKAPLCNPHFTWKRPS